MVRQKPEKSAKISAAFFPMMNFFIDLMVRTMISVPRPQVKVRPKPCLPFSVVVVT